MYRDFEKRIYTNSAKIIELWECLNMIFSSDQHFTVNAVIGMYSFDITKKLVPALCLHVVTY